MMTRPLSSVFLPLGLLLVAMGLCSCNTLAPVMMRPGSFSTVVIDAGHGGKDSGARSRSGLVEKNLALDTAQRLRPLLARAGFRTVMVRSDDTFVELDERVNIANRYPNAVLVSIHYNASGGGWPTGAETFFWRSDSYGLATRVERHLVQSSSLEYRGATRRVLRLTHNPRIPSILCECGFLTNAGEASHIADGSFRQRIAQGIAEGIVDQHNNGDVGIAALPPLARPAVHHREVSRRHRYTHGSSSSHHRRHRR